MKKVTYLVYACLASIAGLGTASPLLAQSYFTGAGGTVTGTTYGAISIGPGSAATGDATDNCGIALGTNAHASPYSVSLGESSEAFYCSVALGSGAIAGAYYASALGIQAVASGSFSIAIGSYAQATGEDSIAMGENRVASGQGAIALNADAMGTGSFGVINGVAVGIGSVAIGDNAVANGIYSVAMNSGTTALGNYSSAFGAGTTTVAPFCFAVGQYNNPETAAAAPLFIVGNGNEGTLHTAFVVRQNGNAEVTGSLLVNGNLVATTAGIASSYVPRGAGGISVNNGNIGIGTLTPTNMLSIGPRNLVSTDRKAIEFNAGGFGSPGAYNTNSNGDKLILYRDAAANYDGTIGIGSSSDMWFKSVGTGNNGMFKWFGGGSNTQFMTLDGSGYLGVGIGEPRANLNVAQGIAIGGGFGSEAINPTAGGKRVLQIATQNGINGGTYDNHTGALIWTTLESGGWGDARMKVALATEWGTYNQANPALVVGQNASSVTGNLGVGVSSPTAKLEVNGNAVFHGVVHVAAGGDIPMFVP